jgi:peptidoglycan/xylan/chitin deacetylase (PgdA/CDA1 family)
MGALSAARALLAAGLLALAAAQASAQPAPDKQVAVTYDDLPLSGDPGDADTVERINATLLAGLSRNRIVATGFVNEGRFGRADAARRRRLLDAWLANGMDLGNHTATHVSMNTTPLAAFQAEVVAGEPLTRAALAAHGRTLRWFRHPYLRTGLKLDERRAFEAWLGERGYRVAPVTLENADYLYAAAYDRALHAGDQARAESVARDYLAFTDRKLAFFEGAAMRLLGRQPRHVLLLHVNALNARTVDAMAALLRRRGYRFVSLDEAMEDPVYAWRDSYVGPAGVNWLWRWSRAVGAPIAWDEEPEPPAGLAVTR